MTAPQLVGPNGRLVAPRVARVTFIIEIPEDVPDPQVEAWIDCNMNPTLYLGKRIRQTDLAIGKLQLGG